MSKSLDLGCGLQPKNPFNAQEVYGVDVRDDAEAHIVKADLVAGRSHLNSDHPQDRLQVVQIPSGGATLALNA